MCRVFIHLPQEQVMHHLSGVVDRREWVIRCIDYLHCRLYMHDCCVNVRCIGENIVLSLQLEKGQPRCGLSLCVFSWISFVRI